MIINFQLLDDDGLIIGKANVDVPFEDIESAKLGLIATGQAYSPCRWIKYEMFYQQNGPKAIEGRIYIQPCPEDY